jgi:hypothetical protein
MEASREARRMSARRSLFRVNKLALSPDFLGDSARFIFLDFRARRGSRAPVY